MNYREWIYSRWITVAKMREMIASLDDGDVLVSDRAGEKLVVLRKGIGVGEIVLFDKDKVRVAVEGGNP